MKEFVIILVLAIAGFLVWGYFASGGIVAETAEYFLRLAERNETLAGLLFFVFAALSVLLGPFTSSPAVPVAVLIWGESITFLLLIAGWVLGSMSAYWIGKYFGYSLVAKLLHKDRADEWRGFVSERVTFLMAFLFRLALPAETGYIFGLVHYSAWKFLVLTLLIELPVAVVMVFASGALIENNFVLFSALVAGILSVFSVAAYFLRKTSKKNISKGQ